MSLKNEELLKPGLAYLRPAATKCVALTPVTLFGLVFFPACGFIRRAYLKDLKAVMVYA